ncbi:MAG: AraC family transcriptional regulator [Defluviitaleaceae bacterium]|nr:AraC family transcriptional regulator [Defluviitaleaceae bacterium]
MFADESIGLQRMVYERDMYISHKAEEGNAKHRTYEDERLYLQRIKEGNVEAVLGQRDTARSHEMYMGRLVEDPRKHVEYRVCAAITLATHAAIDGGLDPASAYAMNDLYLQRLETCKDIPEMRQLCDEMELVFVQEVSRVRQKRSRASYVEKCKLFIDQHLVKPFTLDDISSALNINKSYLSRRFAQEAGMRIMDYARKKRIEAAANMLKYSDTSIADIAANFCFSTQSHFGDLFKRMKGTTPLKFRAENQVIEVRSVE